MSRGTALTRVQAKTRAGGMAEKMAARIATESKDGDELVDFALRVFRDTTLPFDDRRWAFEWLADRGAGKAMAKLEVSSTSSVEVRPSLEHYTFEELEEMERIRARAEERKRIAQATDANGVIDVLPAPTTP